MLEITTQEEFAKEVLEAEVPVLVDFWAPWCQPCQILGPIIEELAKDYEGRAKMLKVNIDDARDIALSHGVMSIPTVAFFKAGEKKDTSIGAVPKQVLAEKLDAIL